MQGFNFNRTKSEPAEASDNKRRKLSDVFEEEDTCDGKGKDGGEGEGDREGPCSSSRFDVSNLLSDGVKVHHLKDLRSAARLLDEIRQQSDDGVESELDLVETSVGRLPWICL